MLLSPKFNAFCSTGNCFKLQAIYIFAFLKVCLSCMSESRIFVCMKFQKTHSHLF